MVPSQDCTLEYTITIDNYQSTTFLKFFNDFYNFSFLYKNRSCLNLAYMRMRNTRNIIINVAIPTKNPPVKGWVIGINIE